MSANDVVKWLVGEVTKDGHVAQEVIDDLLAKLEDEPAAPVFSVASGTGVTSGPGIAGVTYTNLPLEPAPAPVPDVPMAEPAPEPVPVPEPQPEPAPTTAWQPTGDQMAEPGEVTPDAPAQ